MEIVPADKAPELKGISCWANTDPLTISGLKGKVILLDCWTYTCIFCLRTLPIMKRLYQKYSKYGLCVIEAHSREYDFAADKSNILKALSMYNISEVPVAFDTENKTWDAYGNTFWPRHTLIDSNGLIRYEHAGYGGIADFEGAVVELLEEARQAKIEDPLDNQDTNDAIYDVYGMQFAGIAPEICVGYSRLRHFGNNQTVKPDVPTVFTDSPSHDINSVYLRGKWKWERERVSFVTGGKETNPAVVMYFNSAKRVHAILGSNDGRPARAEIKLDGNSVGVKEMGKHCITEGQACTVNIDWPFIYNLAKFEKPEVHEIEVIPRSNNFAFYTFVFG